MADTTENQTPAEDIHELLALVRNLPDFVFGTIFVAEDFPHAEVPEDFSAKWANDLLAETGNRYIWQECGEVE